jgi:glycosyltransferase involved in cell wall biosynthesis
MPSYIETLSTAPRDQLFTGNTATERSQEEAHAPIISVIIPVWNQAACLRRCLDALSRQTLSRSDFEVLVIDNGSEHSVHELASVYNFIRVLDEPKPGSYNARNTGIRHAKGRIIGFTDADCIPIPNWLETALNHFKNKPDLGLLGGKITFIDPTARSKNIYELYEEKTFSVFNVEASIREKNFAPTANMFTRRAVFDLISGFDGNLRSGGDKDWGGRVAKAGLCLLYSDRTIVQHPRRSSYIEIRRKSLRIVGGSQRVRIRQGYNWRSLVTDVFDYFLTAEYFRSHMKKFDSVTGWQRLKAVIFVVRLTACVLVEFVRIQCGCEPRRA